MTATIARVVASRRPPSSAQTSPWGALATVCELTATESSRVRFPSARWRKDPCAFFREVLGITPWSRQIEVAEAVRDHPRVAVKSGHKVSKSNTGAGIGLWFLASFPDARVVMTCVTARQVDEILYREVKKLHARSGLCVDCADESEELVALGRPPLPRPCAHSAVLDGEPRALARSGIQLPDFRQLVGFTAKEAEAVAGVSGSNLLYIVDEASGVDDAIFEAIEGNRAGGARTLYLSNPTRREGEFFRAFTKKRAFYRGITISSEETPNVLEGRIVVPGLATREWVEEKKKEWGVASALYQVRVKGEFPEAEEGKIVTLHELTLAEQRWAETAASGPLEIGLDPAGPGTAGDETAMAARRGLRMVGLRARSGMDEDAIIAELLDFIGQHRFGDRDRVIVRVDREGEVGARVYGAIRAYHNAHPGEFELVGVRCSFRAQEKPYEYELVRDEIWANLRDWIKAGGAIVEDAKLSEELHAPEWENAGSGTRSAILRATDKKRLRRRLNRSPDRADALCLAVWTASPLEVPTNTTPEPGNELDPYEDGGGELACDRVFDPYR
jgi:hypothetical protein